MGQLLCAADALAESITFPPPGVVAVTIGQSTVPLNGPWRFHIGDDSHWAEPDFDDSHWETVDLTSAPGAHDADVGLTGYVPGWTARGHAGYSGYAWYRIRLSATAPAGATLALAGPTDVDDAYQVFFDGYLLGGIGDFSATLPKVYATQPRVFPLTGNAKPQLPPAFTVVAIRAWMSPKSLGAAPDVGGIHIAPNFGEASQIQNLDRVQWLELIRGYFLEILQSLVFVGLAAMSCSMMILDSSDHSYAWLACALILSATARANLAFVSWTQWESANAFDLIQNALLVPLLLGIWTMTWYCWLRLRHYKWIGRAVFGLTAIYIAVQLMNSIFALPHVWVAGVVSSCVRLSFLALTVVILGLAIEQQLNDVWITWPAILLISTGLFAPELSFLKIPAIWFPYGTGVSRTQFAYAAFNIALFLLFLRRLRQYALKRSSHTTQTA
jgi:hypothetical protein